MKKLLIPILALTFAVSSCGDDFDEEEFIKGQYSLEKDKNILYESEDGRFKINFYGEPTKSSKAIPTEVGDVEMITFLYEKSVTEAYMVAYSDYPSKLIENSPVDVLLDGAKNGGVSNLGITIFEFEKNLKIAGNPGRHFKGNNGSSIYVEWKLFLTGNRLYQIAILRDGSYATQERTDDFFGSFELIKE